MNKWYMVKNKKTDKNKHGFIILSMPKIPKGFAFKEADYNQITEKIHVRITKTN